MAYVNDTIAPGFTPAGVTVTSFTAATTLPTGTTGTGLLTVGKLGLVHGATKNTYDFVVNDIFVADSAPLAIVSSATASASVGTAFNYTISTTATSGTRTFGIDPATPLPANLTLNTTTGQITGAPTTVGTYPITLTATDGTTSATTTLTITVTAAATVYRWNNLGNDWSSAGSWDNGGTAPATSALIDTAAFGSDGSGATSVNVGSGNTIKGIVFSNNAYAYTWTGTDIKVLSSGAITNSSSVAQTFGNKIINSSGNATWSSAANGSMVFNGGIDLSDSSTNNTLTFAGAGNATVGGAIANGGGSTAGAVTFTSTGTNLLSGGNMYGGLTTMNAAGGTLTLSGNNSGAAGGVTLTAGTLNINNANALGSGAVTLTAGTINNTSGAAIVNAGNNPVTWGGTLAYGIAGSTSLSNLNLGEGTVTVSEDRVVNFAGTGTELTMGPVNITSTGGRTITANGAGNTLEMGGLTLSAHLSVAQTATLAGNANFNITGPIVTGTALAHGVKVSATGTTTFSSGLNNYGGSTAVRAGATLSIPTGGSLANCGPIVVAGGSTTTANLNLAGEAGVVQVGLNGFVRGGGSMTSLVVDSTGTVEVPLGSTWITDGTITFTGTTTKVSVTGTLVSGETYNLMTATGAITGTPTLAATASTAGWGLRVNGSSLYLQEVGVIIIGSGESDEYSTANRITGTDSMTKRGTGTLILSAANDYTGGTFLEAGTLQIGNSSALGSITTAGAVTLTGGTLKSTVDLNLGRFVAGAPAIVGRTEYQAIYGANSRVQYSGLTTTINGPVTLDVGDGYTMTMGTLIGNSSSSSLVTKTGDGTVKLLGGTTKLNDAGMALNGNASSVLGGWRIEAGTVWFGPSANNGAGNGPIILAGGAGTVTAKFTKLQNSNGTYTEFLVPSDLTLESNGLIQFDPDPLTLLGQNRLGFRNLSIGANTLNVATATTSSPSVLGQGLPSVNFQSATLTGSATLNNLENLDLNLQAVSGTGGFTKMGSGTLYLSDQPNQAAAFAGSLVSGGLVSINVEYAGSGYLVAPAVTVVPVNGGSGAEATATIDNKGRVTSIAVNPAGSGYLSLPRIVIAAPPTVATANSYTGATTVNEGKLNLSGSYATSVTVGSGAALQLDWLAAAQAECSVDGISPTSGTVNASYSYVKNLYLTKSVGGYVANTNFEFDLPAPVRVDGSGTATGTAPYVLAPARASATVDSNGFISALSIVNGGSGYAVPPMVTIPAPTVPTVVARTTGSITFETGAQLSVNNPPIGTGASCTLLTAGGGILGAELPRLLNLPGYSLTKSPDGKSLILSDMRTDPTFSSNPTAAAITYGQSLAPSNLNLGSTSVPGSFTWKNAGTFPPVGTSSQIVTFTPSDLTAYRPAEFTVSVTVNKADPATVFPTAATITYGQALSAATLTGGTGAGTYAFTSSATIPNAGLTQNFEVTFTPTDAVNYNTVRQNVAVTVNKADALVSWPTATPITAGQALSYSTLSNGSATGVGGASVEGAFAWTDSTAAPSTTGSNEVTFTPTSGNYKTATQMVSVTVNPAGTTYSDWLSANGGTASDAAFLDYVFGAVTPGTLPASLNPTVAVTGGDLVLTYYVRKGTLGLTVTPELSLNLGDANGGFTPLEPTLIEYLETSNFGGVFVERRTARVPVSGSKKFLRIQAEQL